MSKAVWGIVAALGIGCGIASVPYINYLRAEQAKQVALERERSAQDALSTAYFYYKEIRRHTDYGQKNKLGVTTEYVSTSDISGFRVRTSEGLGDMAGQYAPRITTYLDRLPADFIFSDEGIDWNKPVEWIGKKPAEVKEILGKAVQAAKQQFVQGIYDQYLAEQKPDSFRSASNSEWANWTDGVLALIASGEIDPVSISASEKTADQIVADLKEKNKTAHVGAARDLILGISLIFEADKLAEVLESINRHLNIAGASYAAMFPQESWSDQQAKDWVLKQIVEQDEGIKAVQKLYPRTQGMTR